jgi:hypothetical protein
MHVDPFLEDCPGGVRALIDDLAREPATQSIWLFGSRANFSATATSDWDVLVFSSAEPHVAPRRRKDVDVVRVGPSGRVLVEGVCEDMAFHFQDFQWTVLDGERASYLGKKFRDTNDGYARDISEPVYERSTQAALLIHASDSCVNPLTWRNINYHEKKR